MVPFSTPQECVTFTRDPRATTSNILPLNVYHGPSTFMVRHEFNEFPDIIQYDDINPTISSPNSMYDIQFYMTKESLLDVDLYRQFIGNAVGRFRRSRDYKAIKARLMSMGMDHCQVLGYIQDDVMAKVEMHHNILGIRDIALMITEHIVNTVGMISSFDLIQLLVLEHRLDNVPIVMLSETIHEMYESDPNSYLPPNMTFGKWWELLYRYRYGITLDIANKVISYINKTVNRADPYSDFWIQLRSDVKDWSMFNGYSTEISNDHSIGIIPDTAMDISLRQIA